MIDTLPDQAIKHSVQAFPTPNNGVDFTWSGFIQQRYDLIPPWGVSRRDLALRNIWYSPHQTLIQGAIAGLIMKVRSTPYEISGGRNLTRSWQDVFFEGEFGEGYDVLMDKFLQDFFTQSFGGVFEIIGRGKPDTMLRSQVEGIAHLDAYHCRATGNPEFPIVYFDPESGKTHRMHYSRVARITDLTSPARLSWGRGFSILERAIATSTAASLLSRHEIELLNDQPPTGIVTVSGFNQTQWEEQLKTYKSDQQADGNQLFRGMMSLVGINPLAEVKVNFVPFSQLPEGFDYEKFMSQHVNLLALAIGVDPQDIWPLTGTALGSGQQSRILSAKGEAKTYGATLRRLERFFNSLLPRSLEWKFKPNDQEREKADADTAKVWMEVASAPFLSETEKRQLLANNVEAFADVLLDESGQVRLPDDDPKEDEQTTDDVTEVETDTGGIPGAGGEATTPAQEAAADDTALVEKPTAAKDYQSTQAEFIKALTDLINAGMSDDVSRRRFGTVLRGNLSRLGRRAFNDGLQDGGVEEAASDEDLATIATILTEQSGYVTSFSQSLFSGTVVDAEARAKVWANKSLDQFYMAGLASADINGMYGFEGDDGAESCSTCKRLKGQRHRLRDWIRKKLRPKIDTANFDCGGWRCEHRLVKTKGRASGSY